VRLARVRGVLGAAALAPAEGLLSALSETLAALSPEIRDRALRGPDLRGFLSEVETWLAIRRVASEILAIGSRPRRGARRRRALARLFDRLARTGHLAALVPGGRIDAGLPERCLGFARRRLDDAVADLSAFLLGLRLAYTVAGTVEVRLRFREDPEQGRPAGRIDLGSFAGPAGALAIAVGRGRVRVPRSARRGRPAGPRVRAVVRGRTLFLHTPGAVSTVIPAAGSHLLMPGPGGESRRRTRRPGTGGSGCPSGGPLRLVRRGLVPGTSIVLAPVVDSRPRRMRVTREAPGHGTRLARAMRILLVAWPEAHREVLRRTFMIVPVHEPGTVSWSLASRPGVSFINMSGKSIVDLADDLLHETAHHRLHDLQEVTKLLVDGPETAEVQAFDSPWRGTRRPLHGLLHGAYTFLFRAELLHKILTAARRQPRLLADALGSSGRRVLRRELRRERGMIASALRDLEGAARSGLLAPAGARLLRSMRARDHRLRNS